MPPIAPAEYPPAFDSEDVISKPTDPEDERIEVGIAIVGAGPAGLACANKVLQLLEDRPELAERLGEVPVAVVEKGKVVGAHEMSGANMRPSAMEELEVIMKQQFADNTSAASATFGCATNALSISAVPRL